MTTDMMDVLQAQAGDANCFSRLYRKYYSKVNAFLRKRYYDEHLCEDLTQEAFLSAWAYLHTYKSSKSSFYTWVCTIALNVASKKPYAEMTGNWDDNLAITPETIYNAKRQLQETMEDIEAMPETQKKVAKMRLTEGASYEEISDELGISPAYAKKLVHNTRKKLKGKV